MDTLLGLLQEYGLAFVFLNVLLQQSGVPVPSYPTLIVAGALIGQVGPPWLLLGVATLASLVADVGWYVAGKRYGRRVLSTICRISLSPDSCIRQTENIYLRWGPKSLMVAKLIPGFASVATSLAGVVRTRPAQFLVFDALGAVVWAGPALLIGYLFRDAVADVLEVVSEMGKIGLALIAAALALFILHKWWQRRLLILQLRMDRITVDELDAMLKAGESPVILDVRTEAAQQTGRIPGAQAVSLDAPTAPLADVSRDSEIIIYCACPNEVSAAKIAKALMLSGFPRVRPLAGGIEAWRKAGLSITEG